ncbi:MAG: histidinol-phosphate transaminase [Clostridiales bacterium]|nr:histidinol-phosphate transaminase [Clostridiales bacterium]
MSNFWNKKTNELLPYVAGEQPKDGVKVIKLNTNENPFPPSPTCRAVLDDLDIAELRLYPNTDSQIVRESVANKFKDYIKPENVFVGNGSDEVLAICWQAFFEEEKNTDKKVLVPEISYSFYPVYSQLYDVAIEKIPLKDDFSIDPADYIGKENAGIAIANPNAPTSVALSLSEVEEIVKNNPDRVVLIDEAYAAFKDEYETAITLVNKYPNLIVVKTLSKAYGLAGIRVGYAVGSKELIDGMMRVRDSFNSYPVDRIAQKLAKAAIDDDDYYEMNRVKIIKTRERISKILRDMGFTIPESSANFIFAKPCKVSAEELYLKLKEMGILVRYFNKPKINEYLRITIGTDEEMDSLIEAVKEVVL